MSQSPILIQKGIGGVFNLFKLGSDNKYHFVRVVTEIPLDWKYNPPQITIETPVSNDNWLIDHWKQGRRWMRM
jgi:hypothetical protein